MFSVRALIPILFIALAPVANSAIISFSLTQQGCTTGCSVLPAGTITVSTITANEVFVSVQLGSDYSFRRANDANHWGLVFNLVGNPAITIADVVSGDVTSQGWVLAQTGTFNAQPFGLFEYSLNCTTCSPGMAGVTTRSLSFRLLGAGLTEASFIATNNIYFAVDVMGKTAAAGIGNTGSIGALRGTVVPSVPEPGSLTLLMSAGGTLLGLANLRRSRLQKMGALPASRLF